MDAPLTPLSWLFAALAAAAGFFAPGWCLHRALRSSLLPVACFLGSAAILFNLVLALQVAGLRINFASLALGLALVCGILLLVGPRSGGATCSPGRCGETGLGSSPVHLVLAGASAVGIVAIIARAALDPLSGWDNVFRWDRIARLVLRAGNLSFYPPVTAADFSLYAWADGIPPLVSLLDLWLYAAAGATAAGLTVARVGVEAVLLFCVVRRFAAELWGSAEAGWFAAAMLATSSLAGWSIAMGQETGLTALSLVSMLYFLFRFRADGRLADAVWAAIAASVGALSREYCLIYPVIGVALLGMGGSRRAALVFALVATVATLPWYARNAWITGNPLFSHGVMGLFPVNQGYRAWMEATSTFAGFWVQENAPLRSASLLLLGAAPLLVLGAAGLFHRANPWRTPLIASAAVVTALWLWSIHETLGGLTFSSRILLPGFAVAAVASGWVATHPSTRLRAALAVLALVFTLDAAARAGRIVPSFPPADSARIWPRLIAAADGGGILVDHPNYHVAIGEAGGVPVSMFSPVAAPVFSTEGVAGTIAALRAGGIRFVVLTRGNPVNSRIGFLRELPASVAALQSGSLDVYDLALGLIPPMIAPVK